MASSSASRPRRLRVTPCQAVTKRPSAAGSTGSTWCRSLASERRRIWRSTPGSHHSRCVPPGRNSPSCRRPGADGAPQHRLDHRPRRARSARATSPVGERPVRARVAQHQIAQRIADRLEQRVRQAGRQRHAERVAIARRVLDGDEPRLAGDRQRAARRRACTSVSIAVGGRRASTPRAARSPRASGRRAQQQVVQAVGGLDVALRRRGAAARARRRRWRRGRAGRAARRRRAAPRSCA